MQSDRDIAGVSTVSSVTDHKESVTHSRYNDLGDG